MVSHELRTPLTSIRGSLGLLASGKLGALTDAGERMLDIAVHNTDRLVRLIGDILDVERIESGRFVPECVPTRVNEIVEDAALAMQAAAEKAGIAIDVEADELTVLADRDRTVQALTNLLDNALKFSPHGSRVRVRARRDGGAARFSIEDRGRGIAPEHLEVIFERFRQIDSSDTRRKGGSGLGLAIARGIVQQQSGRIWAESEQGRGSTFHFTLPLATSPGAATAPAADVAEGARV
jgi:signal transduction histidine kinase